MEDTRCGEITDLLDHLEDIIEEGKTGFLSSKVTIDKENLLKVVEDIRLKLPGEIKHSVWLMEDRKKILLDAQKEARVILEEAKEQVEVLTAQDQIMQIANERASNIIATAKSDALQMQTGAIAYAEDTCRELEQKLKLTLESIHKEVQEFESYITDMLGQIYDNRLELRELSNQLQEQEQLK